MIQEYHKSASNCVFLVIFLFLFLNLSGSLPKAYASGHAIWSQSPTTVPAGQTVEDVVVIGNQADISGRVLDTVIVINGDVHLTSTAKADVVISIGGHIVQDPGARVHTLYSLSFSTPLRNSLEVSAVLLAALWSLRLAGSASLLLLPLLLSFLVKPMLNRTMVYIESSARRTLLTGLLASIGFLAVMALLALTIVGLPLAALLLLLYALLGLIGLTAVSTWIGKNVNPQSRQEKPLWLQSLIGAALIMAFSNVPLIGPFIFALLWILGIGASVSYLWVSGSQLRKTRRERRRSRNDENESSDQ